MISFILNGENKAVENSDITLLEYLRGVACLKGTKNGCNKAQCGACTVIVDGKAKRSCVLKIDKCAGAKIETIEGLAKDGKLHPLQEAFIKTGAVQCGFCSPGMIMAAKALLDVQLDPSEEEIKEALKFNLCRCTGYIAIIEAVQLAAAVMRGAAEFPAVASGMVGTSVVRNDVLKKALGEPVYTDDFDLEGQLYGQVVYTEYPYAKVLKIDTSAAKKAEGVQLVITAADIPGKKTFGLLSCNQPVMIAEGEHACYIGDSVACVIADTKAQAIVAAKLVKVEYEVKVGVFDAPTMALPESKAFLEKGKIISHTKVRRGDVNKAFAEADVIVEGDYYVPFIEHAYMEPEAAVSCYLDGKLTVYTGCQGVGEFVVNIADCLAIPRAEMHVIGREAGGGFGGKEECTVHIHAALATKILQRPVKIVMTREESLKVSTKRHAENLHYKMAAKKDGTITAIESTAIVDTGAYDSLGLPVVFRSGVVAAGPYQVENAHTDSIGYYTNNPPGGAFRGFGSSQATVAAEIHIDRLAEALKMDPYTIREKNALAPGKQSITGQTIGDDCGYPETIAVVKKRMSELADTYKPSGANKRIGFGIASSYKNVGLGTGLQDNAGAIVELTANGQLRILHGAFEIGQGCNTIMAQIAAETTKIPYAAWLVLMNDSEICPEGGETTASRQTFVTGNAVKFAAADFAIKLKKALKEIYGLEKAHMNFELLGVRDDLSGKLFSWQEIAKKAFDKGLSLNAAYDYTPPATVRLPENNTPPEGHNPKDYDIHIAYCYATHGVIIEADEQTGEYKVLHVVASHDAGKVINPMAFKGQVEGGVVMGIGYGVSEEYALNQGVPITTDLGKCRIPKIADTPKIDVINVERTAPEGPYGAKGMGELPINPPAPAISNALFNALGVRLTHFPITKEKVVSALAVKNA